MNHFNSYFTNSYSIKNQTCRKFAVIRGQYLEVLIHKIMNMYRNQYWWNLLFWNLRQILLLLFCHCYCCLPASFFFFLSCVLFIKFPKVEENKKENVPKGGGETLWTSQDRKYNVEEFPYIQRTRVLAGIFCFNPLGKSKRGKRKTHKTKKKNTISFLPYPFPFQEK